MRRLWLGVCSSLTMESRRYTRRFFTAESVSAILGKAAEPRRTIFAVAAMNGLRPGEVLGLSTEDWILRLDKSLCGARRGIAGFSRQKPSIAEHRSDAGTARVSA